MLKVPFYKMSGSGNDFIIIDNCEGIYDALKTPEFVAAVCRRSMSIGADGLIFIENSKKCDFIWHFYNSDGSAAEMCGNGARCAARFAFLNGIAGENMSFETVAGIITAQVKGTVVKVRLSQPGELKTDVTLDVDGESLSLSFINTGVPHAIISVDDIETVQVKELGSRIRFHEHFQPAGTNANFISIDSDNVVNIRTYERGVEDETFACGTGAVAAALVATAMGRVSSPIKVKTRSNEILTVYANENSPPFKEVYLEGDARVVYEGVIWDEAYRS